MSGTELVLVFADLDAEKLVTGLLRRGIERGCLRPLRWESVRDPMRDARLAQQPLAALGPRVRADGTRFVVVWDHHGSGREGSMPTEVESEVLDAFERAGVRRERVAAVAFVPELEATLEPVWDRVLEVLARRRNEAVAPVGFDAVDPKAALEEAVRVHRLRVDSTVFEDLGGHLSLAGLKRGAALRRVAARLTEWFGS